MRLKRVLGSLTLLGLATSLFVGCGSQGGTDVPLAPAPPADAGKSVPVPTDVKAGGGPGSSGHMNKSPGADS